MKRHMIHEHSFKGAFHTWLVFLVDFETYIALAAQRHIVFYRWNRMEGEFEQLNTIYMGDSLSSIEGLVAVNVSIQTKFHITLLVSEDRNVLKLDLISQHVLS